MALTQAPKTARCPHCKIAGPYNFVLQDRVTLKNPDDEKFPGVYNVVETKRFYACAYCGHIAYEA